MPRSRSRCAHRSTGIVPRIPRPGRIPVQQDSRPQGDNKDKQPVIRPGGVPPVRSATNQVAGHAWADLAAPLVDGEAQEVTVPVAWGRAHVPCRFGLVEPHLRVGRE